MFVAYWNMKGQCIFGRRGNQMNLCSDSDSNNYYLPESGYFDDNSFYESYFYLLESYGVSSELSKSLRRMAFNTTRSLGHPNDSYIKNDVDMIMFPINTLMENVLYSLEKKKGFDCILRIVKKHFFCWKRTRL